MKKRRAPWPRWAKILRNILLTALLVFLMWDAWLWPTFSYRADLRRVERRMLFPEPEMTLELETFYGHLYRIDLAGDMAVTAFPLRGSFFAVANPSRHFLREEPELFCVPYEMAPRDEADPRQPCAVYAVFRPPADTARAVLTLHNKDGDFTAGSVWEEGICLFYVCPGLDVLAHNIWCIPDNYTYELAFYDADGNVIQEISG